MALKKWLIVPSIVSTTKLVSLLKVWQYGLPLAELSSFPVIGEHNAFYWLLYSAVGVLLPILLWELNHRAGMALRRR